MKHLLLFLCVIAGAGCSSRPPHSSHEIEAFVRECEGIERRCELLKERITIINSHIIEGRSKVSFYSDYFEGKVTASGIRFSNQGRQIAHKSLGFGTVVFFYGEGNQRRINERRGGVEARPASTYGVITDRGPYIKGRDFDVTYKMATELGMVKQGVIEVEWIGLLPEWR